jgi:cutinase
LEDFFPQSFRSQLFRIAQPISAIPSSPISGASVQELELDLSSPGHTHSCLSTMKFSAYTLSGLLSLAAAAPVPELKERNTPLNVFITDLLKYLPDVDASISSLVGILTDFESALVSITGEQDTYNGLGGACTDYTLVFARGTTEPGNVGILVGPPLITAITDITGASALTVQGVNNYGATVDGYLAGGDAAGSTEM